MSTNSLSIVRLLAMLCLAAAPTEGADDIDMPLQQLHKDVVTKTHRDAVSGGEVVSIEAKDLPHTDAQTVALRLKAIIEKEDFGPTPGAALRIGMCADIVMRLTPALKGDVPGSDGHESDVLKAVKQFMAKVSSNIDEEWTFQRVTANVAPPPGVPNAAAGMNPEAIGDPQLRKEYVAKLQAERAKQEKNNQQTGLRRAREKVLWALVGVIPSGGKAGWTRADLAKHFTTNSKSKEILNDYLRKAGRAE